jgi:hypothetical protein
VPPFPTDVLTHVFDPHAPAFLAETMYEPALVDIVDAVAITEDAVVVVSPAVALITIVALLVTDAIGHVLLNAALKPLSVTKPLDVAVMDGMPFVKVSVTVVPETVAVAAPLALATVVDSV